MKMIKTRLGLLLLVFSLFGACAFFGDDGEKPVTPKESGPDSKKDDPAKKVEKKEATFSPFKFLKDSELEDVYRAFGKLSMRTKMLEDEVFYLKNKVESLELKLKDGKRAPAKSLKEKTVKRLSSKQDPGDSDQSATPATDGETKPANQGKEYDF